MEKTAIIPALLPFETRTNFKKEAIENPARYIIRAWFSSVRMTDFPADKIPTGMDTVIYESKDDRTSKAFDALDWLARLTTHIPNRPEQMMRHYGYYSNKARGMAKRPAPITICRQWRSRR